MPETSLVVIDPGHFHATLVQQQMYPELSPVVGFDRMSSGARHEPMRELLVEPANGQVHRTLSLD
jgi:hypothetical protein